MLYIQEIERIIRENDGVEFLNLSTIGAKIMGAKEEVVDYSYFSQIGLS